MKTFRENLLKYGTCFLVFLLPLFYVGNMLFPFISPKIFFFYGFVETLTAFWIYALLIDSSYRLSKKNLLYFLPLFCFIGWMTVAGILALNPDLSFWSSFSRGTGLITLYHCFILALIVSSLVKHNGVDYVYKLMRWFVNGGFVLAISIWCGNEGLNMFSFLKDSNGGGLMGNSSLTAAYLMFILSFGLFLFISKSNSGNKWWLGTKIAVILFSPIFVNILGLFNGRGLLGSARGAILGLIVSLLVAFVWYLLLSPKKNIRIIGTVLVILGIMVFTFLWIQLETPNTRLHQDFIKVATGTRFICDNIAQKAMNEYPWFGYGPENYIFAYQKYFDPELSLPKYLHESWGDRAHNIYYDTGVSGGYPAIIFYSLFILSILYVLYRLNTVKVFNRLQIAILAGAITGYVFQNLFVFDSLLSIMVLFVLAGAVFSSERSLIKEKYLSKPINSFLRNFIIVMLITACITFLIFLSFRPAEKSFIYYRFINMPIIARANYYSDLLKGSSVGEDWDVGGFAYLIFGTYNSNSEMIKNNQKLLPYAKNDLKFFLQYLEKVAVKNKLDVRLDLSIVDFYNTLNYLNDTPYNPALGDHLFNLLNQAQNLSPTNPEVYWTMAPVYIWKGDYKAAEGVYQKAIALDPSISASHQFLIKFAQAIGDKKLYNNALNQAQKDIPGFIFSN